MIALAVEAAADAATSQLIVGKWKAHDQVVEAVAVDVDGRKRGAEVRMGLADQGRGKDEQGAVRAGARKLAIAVQHIDGAIVAVFARRADGKIELAVTVVVADRHGGAQLVVLIGSTGVGGHAFLEAPVGVAGDRTGGESGIREQCQRQDQYQRRERAAM